MPHRQRASDKDLWSRTLSLVFLGFLCYAFPGRYSPPLADPHGRHAGAAHPGFQHHRREAPAGPGRGPDGRGRPGGYPPYPGERENELHLLGKSRDGRLVRGSYPPTVRAPASPPSSNATPNSPRPRAPSGQRSSRPGRLRRPAQPICRAGDRHRRTGDHPASGQPAGLAGHRATGGGVRRRGVPGKNWAARAAPSACTLATSSPAPTTPSRNWCWPVTAKAWPATPAASNPTIGWRPR